MSNSETVDLSDIFITEYSTVLNSNTNKVNVDDLAKKLKTNLKTGLDTSNSSLMKWRENVYGNNHAPEPEQLHFFDFVLECFEDPMLKILLASAIVSLIIGLSKDGIKTGWIEGT